MRARHHPSEPPQSRHDDLARYAVLVLNEEEARLVLAVAVRREGGEGGLLLIVVKVDEARLDEGGQDVAVQEDLLVDEEPASSPALSGSLSLVSLPRFVSSSSASPHQYWPDIV